MAPPGRAARSAIALAAGIGLALAQPPLSLWPLAPLAVAVLCWLLARAPSPGAAARIGLLAGFAFFAAGLHWVVEAFLVDIARHGWMAPFALGFLAAGLSLFWGLPFWLAARARLAPGAAALLLAGLWTLSEFARAHVLTGFPWALPGYVWAETPLAQTAALFGPHMLGFLTLLGGACLALAVLGRGRMARLAPLAAALVAAAGWLWGAARLAAPAPQRADGFTIRIVQPNAAQRDKWRPEMIPVFYRVHLDESAAPPRPDAVIWSESAVPWLPDEDPALRRDIAGTAGVPVILGANRREGGRWFNALFVIAPDSSVAARYDKYRLVPFGEFLPLPALFERLGLSGLTGGSFSPGDGPRVIAAAGIPPFLPLICYEAIFPQGMRAGRRPDWLVQLTNDAWFGTSAGPWQHLAQARMRAIEQGLPLARAANTGISALIDPMGRMVVALPLLARGHVDAVLPAPLPPTPYALTGDAPWIGLILVFSVTCITFGRGIASRALTKNTSQS
ncbi:MAG: apolipoprotein N-acyltransferase [Alphaproteobacteria bacterium]|nr:MAG: apolipoprotein N-acyltransferase [Alphaproteobacteria bacterium]